MSIDCFNCYFFVHLSLSLINDNCLCLEYDVNHPENAEGEMLELFPNNLNNDRLMALK